MPDSTERYSHRDLSETVLGLIAERRIVPSVVQPEWFASPLDEGCRALQQPGATKEDLLKVVPADLVTLIHNKVSNMNGAGEWYDWPNALKEAYDGIQLAEQMKRDARALEQNRPVDLGHTYQLMTNRLADKESGLVRASELNYREYKPFIKSGNAYIDEIIGGWPTDGPIVVFGDTGVGKSHFGAGVVVDLLKAHVDWTAIVYTFEMGVKHWMWRETQMYPAMERFLDRLYVSSTQEGAEQMVAEIATKRPNFVLIDDMDNMVKGEASAAAYEANYKHVKTICRLQEIPVMVLGQPNRAAKTGGRFLRKHDISWSGAGENSAALMIALQNATKLADNWSDDTYPVEPRLMQYMMFLKSRDGWPKQQGPGAIVMEFDPQRNTIWKGPLYKGLPKLWMDGKNGTPLSGVLQEAQETKPQGPDPMDKLYQPKAGIEFNAV